MVCSISLNKILCRNKLLRTTIVMKNILFAPLLLLISYTETKLLVSNNTVNTDKVLEIKQKGILRFGAVPVTVFLDNGKVGRIGARGKLIIPVREGSHTVKFKAFPYSKKYTFVVNQQDTTFLSFRGKLFGFKIAEEKK